MVPPTLTMMEGNLHKRLCFQEKSDIFLKSNECLGWSDALKPLVYSETPRLLGREFEYIVDISIMLW